MKTIIEGKEYLLIGIQESEYMAMKDEIQALKDINQLKTEIITNLEEQVTILKSQIAILQKQLADCEATVPPPPPTPPPSTEPSFKVDYDKVGLTKTTSGYKFSGLTLPSFIEGVDLDNNGSEPHVVMNITGSILNAAINSDMTTDSATSRAQVTTRVKTPPAKWRTSHKVFIHPDFAHLLTFTNKISWAMLYEIKARRDSAMSGNSSGSCRWNLNLMKDQGGTSFYWWINGEYLQPSEKEFDDMFPKYYNKEVAIPIGQWFTLYCDMVHGEKGSLKYSIQLDGQAEQVLFDLKDIPTHYPGRPELGVWKIQANKFYFDKVLIDYMRNAGKKLAVQWEAFKLWI